MIIKHEAQLSDYVRMSFIYDFFRCIDLCSEPYLLGKLLYIVRVIIGKRHNALAEFVADMLTCLTECGADRMHPFRSCD